MAPQDRCPFDGRPSCAEAWARWANEAQKEPFTQDDAALVAEYAVVAAVPRGPFWLNQCSLVTDPAKFFAQSLRTIRGAPVKTLLIALELKTAWSVVWMARNGYI